jgi:hypothetical protein
VAIVGDACVHHFHESDHPGRALHIMLHDHGSEEPMKHIKSLAIDASPLGHAEWPALRSIRDLERNMGAGDFAGGASPVLNLGANPNLYATIIRPIG